VSTWDSGASPDVRLASTAELRVGMVGYAFMGAAHSQAWRTVNRVFDLPARARMVAVCGRDTAKVSAAAHRLGWDEAVTDWRTLVARDDIDLIDICTPGDSHAEIALAALAAGKHVLCEKPLANTVAEAEAMAAAAAAAATAGVRAMCGYNYRRVPAVALMAHLIGAGRIGTVRHVRAVYLQDWIVDPQFPLVWRLQREKAGSGALGDIGAHIVDLTQYVTGQHITGLSAITETFITERPLPTDSTGLSATTDPHPGNPHPDNAHPDNAHPDRRRTGPVTVDDAALFIARLDGGSVATYEATRFATGRKNGLRVEVNGSTGSLAFDLERLNELQFYDATTTSTEQGFSRILVTEPSHPYLTAWWPPGHIIGYEHSFTHQARDLIEAITTGQNPRPSFDDAVGVQRVLDAVERSAKSGVWIQIEKAPHVPSQSPSAEPGPAAEPAPAAEPVPMLVALSAEGPAPPDAAGDGSAGAKRGSWLRWRRANTRT
jgi:predicted dehydrogenase